MIVFCCAENAQEVGIGLLSGTGEQDEGLRREFWIQAGGVIRRDGDAQLDQGVEDGEHYVAFGLAERYLGIVSGNEGEKKGAEVDEAVAQHVVRAPGAEARVRRGEPFLREAARLLLLRVVDGSRVGRNGCVGLSVRGRNEQRAKGGCEGQPEAGVKRHPDV